MTQHCLKCQKRKSVKHTKIPHDNFSKFDGRLTNIYIDIMEQLIAHGFIYMFIIVN